MIAIYCSSLYADMIGKVYFYGFDIQRITGLHENEIEKYGCLYELNKYEFISLLRAEPGAKYQKLDIRAKAVFGNDIYFIDREGIVRNDINYYSIDRKKFKLLFSQIGRCS
jgi:hypothetical protein